METDRVMANGVDELPNGESHQNHGIESVESVELIEPLPKQREMVGRADQVYNKQKRKWEYFKTIKPKARKFKFTKYVVFVRRIINEKGLPTGQVQIDIRGPRLQEALQAANSDTQGFSMEDDPPMIDRRVFYHSLKALESRLEEEKVKQDGGDGDLIYELEAGIKFVREEFEQTFVSIKILLAKNEITFATLWTLFPPNIMIVGDDGLGQPQAYILRDSGQQKTSDGAIQYILHVDYLDSDGKRIDQVETKLIIASFMGAKTISDLSAFPLDLHPDRDAVRKELLETGRKALTLHGRHLVEYKGHGLRMSQLGPVKFNTHGRVMLDPVVLKDTQPNNGLVPNLDRVKSSGRQGKSNTIRPPPPKYPLLLVEDEVGPGKAPLTAETLTEEQIMVLNPLVYGFSLGDKCWGEFAVSQISDVSWNDAMFDNLVLAKDQRDFVHDLVSGHQAGDNDFDDFVRDKGKGLVGLLAGPPGVGKTLTAEAIAEVTRRPLYMVSSGELGEAPSAIHDKLVEILELAELWDAVVLLDEADVFLTERDDTNLMRNAIASIFLRELEYYQGILILTTNRLKSFDSAFQSRIHFCVKYPDLDGKGRESIWRSFFQRAAANENVQVEVDDRGITELSRLNLNGRQIKNIMSISQAVSVKRKQALTVEKIKTAVRLSQNFTNDSFAAMYV